MQSIQNLLLKGYFKLSALKSIAKKPRLQDFRDGLERLGERSRLPEALKRERLSANGIPAERLQLPQSRPGRMLFYLHGGGYVMGSLNSHRGLACQLAKTLEATAIVPDYRLAPRYPFPAAVDDTVNAWYWLSQQEEAREIVLAGDSAGGGLALALLLKLREEQLRMPEAVVLLAPWADLTNSSEELARQARLDPMLRLQGLALAAKAYAHRTAVDNPYISPLLGQLHGLPPVLIQVGTHDILLNDSLRLEKKLKAAGVETDLKVWPKMLHVWQMYYDFLPEARKALAEVGRFGRKILGD